MFSYITDDLGVGNKQPSVNTGMYTIQSVVFNSGFIDSYPDTTTPSSYKIGNNPHTTIEVVENLVSAPPLGIGQIYRSEVTLQPVSITGFDEDQNAFIVDGNETKRFPVGSMFDITGGQYFGTYTVVSSAVIDFTTYIVVFGRLDLPLGSPPSFPLGMIKNHSFGYSESSVICGQVPPTFVQVAFKETLDFDNIVVSFRDDVIAYNLENNDKIEYDLPVTTLAQQTTPNVPEQSSPPSTSINALWFDTNGEVLKQWNDDWIEIKTAWWFDITNNLLYYRTKTSSEDTGWIFEQSKGYSSISPAIGEMKFTGNQIFVAPVNPDVFLLTEISIPLIDGSPGNADATLIQVSVNSVPANIEIISPTMFRVLSPNVKEHYIVEARVYDRSQTQANAQVMVFSGVPHTAYHPNVVSNVIRNTYSIQGGNYIERFSPTLMFTGIQFENADPSTSDQTITGVTPGVGDGNDFWTVDGTSLVGILNPGDTFQVVGDSGIPDTTYTLSMLHALPGTTDLFVEEDVDPAAAGDGEVDASGNIATVVNFTEGTGAADGEGYWTVSGNGFTGILNPGDTFLVAGNSTIPDTEYTVQSIGFLPNYTDITPVEDIDPTASADGTINKVEQLNAGPVGNWNATAFPILSINPINGTITIDGDYTWLFNTGDVFQVQLSSTNYNNFKVVSSSTSEGTTMITVATPPSPDDVSSATVKYLYVPEMICTNVDVGSKTLTINQDVTSNFLPGSRLLLEQEGDDEAHFVVSSEFFSLNNSTEGYTEVVVIGPIVSSYSPARVRSSVYPEYVTELGVVMGAVYHASDVDPYTTVVAEQNINENVESIAYQWKGPLRIEVEYDKVQATARELTPPSIPSQPSDTDDDTEATFAETVTFDFAETEDIPYEFILKEINPRINKIIVNGNALGIVLLDQKVIISGTQANNGVYTIATLPIFDTKTQTSGISVIEDINYREDVVVDIIDNTSLVVEGKSGTLLQQGDTVNVIDQNDQVVSYEVDGVEYTDLDVSIITFTQSFSDAYQPVILQYNDIGGIIKSFND
jgi:hypothetical protein